MRSKRIAVAVLLSALSGSGQVLTDNPLHHNGVGRIYDPYVQATEKELEFRSLYQWDDSAVEDGVMYQRLGYGFSVNDRVFAEAYAIASRFPDKSLAIEAYELEAKVQLTEQGEYNADWGLLVEYERELSESIAEIAATLISTRQWGDWVGTVNVGLEYEFGSDITDEIDRYLNAQWRYRYSPALEPGVEFYADEYTRGIGPVVAGTVRGQGRRKWTWEAGLIAPLNDTTPDSTFRFLLEYEF